MTLNDRSYCGGVIVKKKYYLLSFFIPCITYIFLSLLVNGGYNFIIKLPDVDSQYIPLYKYVKGIFLFNNSIFYSFYKGVGGSMWTTFFYYLSSPFNVLILFFSNNDIGKFIYFISAIKISLCGLCMFIYLQSMQDNKKVSLIFSLCYALMGYNVCYIKNIFWFDVVYITPIVMLGINRILKNGNIMLYIVSLIYAIFSNFYMAFSLCIFCIIYFFFFLITNQDIKKQNIIKFFVSSAIIIGISCIFLIPVGYELFQLKERIGVVSLVNNDMSNIIYLLYKLLIGSSDLKMHFIMEFYESPNIYCSLLCLLLNILYFFNNSIKHKEKKYVIAIYLFFISSMIFNPVYSFWHGFSYTNGNPYRFSYLWTFFEILIAYKSFNSLCSLNKKKIVSILILIITIFICNVLLLFSQKFEFYNCGLEIILSIIFIVAYLFFIIENKSVMFIVVILLAELCLNMYLSTDIRDINYKFSNYNDICKNYDNILSKNKFRINAPYYNSSLYCNFSTISSYLSSYNPNILNFFRSVGLSIIDFEINDDYSTTDVLESILGVSYYINNDYNIEKYKYNLSIGYMIYYNKKLASENKIDYQQSILKSMVNLNDNYFIEYQLQKKDNSHYGYFNNGNTKYLLIKDNRHYIVDSKFLNEDYHITFNSIDSLIIKINDSSDNYVDVIVQPQCKNHDSCLSPEVKFYELDMDNFEKAINILKEQQLNVTKMDKNVLEGNIDVKKNNQYLFLSIPYEKGWNIYVDGKKVNYEKLYDAFIGIKLDKGHHEIKMKFYPYGLKLGICISIGSFIILIGYLYKNKKSR